MKRVEGVPEFLDGHLEDAATLRGNLRDLKRVNRLTGGAGLSRRAIAFLAPPPDPLTVLDVGTGAADIPVALLAEAGREGRQVTCHRHRQPGGGARGRAGSHAWPR